MNARPEYELLLIDRAAGELADADRLQVELHLADCRACAAEAEAFIKVLSAVALPPRSDEEHAALASLARRTTRAAPAGANQQLASRRCSRRDCRRRSGHAYFRVADATACRQGAPDGSSGDCV
jgi:anti-sigma factor RsiW